MGVPAGTAMSTALSDCQLPSVCVPWYGTPITLPLRAVGVLPEPARPPELLGAVEPPPTTLDVSRDDMKLDLSGAVGDSRPVLKSGESVPFLASRLASTKRFCAASKPAWS